MANTNPAPISFGLSRLEGCALPTYASEGAQTKAREVAERAKHALDWLTALFGPQPTPPIYVVGPEDWNRVARVPVYGLPHTFPDRTVVSTTPAAFWRDYTDVLTPRLTEEGMAELCEAYGDPPDLGAEFPDLLIVHELTHLYHAYDEATGTTDFPQLWLAELFANIGLYGYLADVEPATLPLVETISHASHAAGPEPWTVHNLNHMEDSLAHGPLNYCWFEFLLIQLAQQIWELGGPAAFTHIHDTLRQPLTDDEILNRLADIHPDIAATVRNWPG
jgi:hypothetical protein